MYELPGLVDLVPGSPEPTFRLAGEMDAHTVPAAIRAKLVSPCMDILCLRHVPTEHNDKLHRIGGTFRPETRVWFIIPNRSNWTWLIRYLVRNGVGMDRVTAGFLQDRRRTLEAKAAA